LWFVLHYSLYKKIFLSSWPGRLYLSLNLSFLFNRFDSISCDGPAFQDFLHKVSVFLLFVLQQSGGPIRRTGCSWEGIADAMLVFRDFSSNVYAAVSPGRRTPGSKLGYQSEK